MVLKDWKKAKQKGVSRWTIFNRKNPQNKLIINKSFDYGKVSYEIRIINPYNLGTTLRNAKTKSQALAYAKAYMKKH